MKPLKSCMLFGSYHALSGIKDAVILFHSVIGCNFGVMGPHLLQDMSLIRQSSTVISDREVIYGGEDQIRKAVGLAKRLYHPSAVFVVSGCVPEITGDDGRSVCAGMSTEDCPVVYVPSPGFLKDEFGGYEDAAKLLSSLAYDCEPDEKPRVNILGLSADDPRAESDIMAIGEMLPGVKLGYVSSSCALKDVRELGRASLNLVIGRGEALAKALRDRFGTPYELISYPYGITGMTELTEAVKRHLDTDLSGVRERFLAESTPPLEKIFSYVQALYAMPAAVIAERSKAEGLKRFLTKELGMDVEAYAREDFRDAEEIYDRIRSSEAAVIFGSGYEKPLAEELCIPLVRMCYPVLDRICVSGRGYVGGMGTVCLVEDMLNEIMAARLLRGGLYQ